MAKNEVVNNRSQIIRESNPASKIIDQFEQCVNNKPIINKESVTKPSKLSKERLNVFKAQPQPERATPSNRGAASGRVKSWTDTLEEAEKSKKGTPKTAAFFSENKELERAREECAQRARFLSELREKYNILLDNFNEARSLLGFQVHKQKSVASDRDNRNQLKEENDQLMTQSTALKDKLSQLVNIDNKCKELEAEVYTLREKEQKYLPMLDELEEKNNEIYQMQRHIEGLRSQFDVEVKRLNDINAKNIANAENDPRIAELETKVNELNMLDSEYKSLLHEYNTLKRDMETHEANHAKELDLLKKKFQDDRLELDTAVEEQKKDYDKLLVRVNETEAEFLYARQQYKADIQLRTSTIAKLESELVENRDKLQHLEDMKQSYEETLKEEKMEKSTLSGILNQKENDILILSKKRDDEVNNMTNQIDKLNIYIREIEKQASMDRESLECEMGKLELSEGRIKEYEDTIEGLSAKIEEYKLELDGYDKGKIELEAQKADLANEYKMDKDLLQKQITEYEDNIQQYKDKIQVYISTIEEKNKLLESKDVELKSKNDEIEILNSNLEKNVKHMEQKDIQHKKQISDWELKIQEANGRITSYKSCVDEQNNELESQRKLIKEIEEEIARLMEKSEYDQNELTNMNSSVISLQSDLADANATLAYIQSEYEELQSREAKVAGALEDVTNTNSKLERERSEHATDLAIMKELMNSKLENADDHDFNNMFHNFKNYLKEVEYQSSQFNKIAQKYTEIEELLKAKEEDIVKLATQLKEYEGREASISLAKDRVSVDNMTCKVEINATRVDKGIVNEIRFGTPETIVDRVVRGGSVQSILEDINLKESKLRELENKMTKELLLQKKREDRVVEKENHIKERLAKLREKETKLFDMVRKIKDRNEQIKGLKQNMLELKEKWGEKNNGWIK